LRQPSGPRSNPSPRVSIGVPTINRPAFFREALASLSSQTSSDFEIVVADNSGETGLQRQIDAIMAEFPHLRFVLVRQPVRVDMASNFNSLIEAARGEFWSCLPDDDRYCPGFIQQSVASLDRHPECDFTFSDHWIIRDDGTIDETCSVDNSVHYGRPSLREGVYRHDRLFQIALSQSMCLQTMVFRRPMIAALKFVPGIFTLDDCLFLRLASGTTAFNGYYLDQRLMEYRLHPAQFSSTAQRADFLRAEIAALESVIQIPARHRSEYNRKLGRRYMALALLEAEQGNSTARVWANAIRGLALSPGFRSALGALLAMVTPRAIPFLRRLAAPFRSDRLG